MSILDFLKRRGARRTFQQLYEHWLESDMPPAEGTPHLLISDKERADEQVTDEDTQLGESLYSPISRASRTGDMVQLRLPMRHVLVGVALIAFLLVALAITLTVLIMRSC